MDFIHIFMLTIMFVINVAWTSDSSQKHNMADDRTKRLLLNDPDVVGSRLTNLERTIQDLRKVTVQQAQSISQLQGDLTLMKNHGSTYVRWGRKQCSGVNTEMIYTGFTAGQAYFKSKLTGGPSNMLCLPNNPELSNRTVTGNSYLYGTEFKEGDFFRKNAQNEDTPCAFL